MQTEILATRTWVTERANNVTDPYAFTLASDGTIIGYNVDYDTRVVIPDTVNTIAVTGVAAGAFNVDLGLPGSYGDKAVTLIVGPTTSFEIGDYAFAGCTSLSAVLLYGDKPTVGAGIFDDIPSNQVTVYRLSGTADWESTLGGMPVIEVDDFDSVLHADKPLYLHDTVTKRIHEIRITNSTLTTGLIQ